MLDFIQAIDYTILKSSKYNDLQKVKKIFQNILKKYLTIVKQSIILDLNQTKAGDTLITI